ncbi:unnamed protein product [Parascedosporium putredinis]|uniref:FHA domain-containing protein n=1 Tax=Parascedosporium putredinis TaxID=1442378 RepID=A0A9P1GWF2_9PEZI|nr:unnamed protein product [Parascedosporium putredinis]CAI7988229.1 unnamed protein product [Parascedosporium putredinis]
MHPLAGGQPQNLTQQQAVTRPLTDQMAGGIPVLHLLSLNGTFERKTIQVPFAPDTLRIGRQTNQKTVPTPSNGYFDSKVLSRQHAEIWADRSGKIWIRDVKSSNGTFVNGTRLSQENRESEPHELQTADHLELGIDIVSEDQKTVVHHKVAAKVEHAGFLSPSSNLLDMNFGDLDPANGNVLSSGQRVMHAHSRNGSNAPAMGNGRMISTAGLMGGPTNGAPHQRGYWVAPITAEQIVKRLQTEMRGAKLQSQDLGRTGQFLSTMMTKEDVKDFEKPEAPEPPKQHMQPLPEKPDIPALKRGTTERPKSHPSNTSPIRDNIHQILQLQEDLKNTKRELEGRDAKLRELEESLHRERLARESAEDIARKLEESAVAATLAAIPSELEGAGSEASSDDATILPHMNGSAKGGLDEGLLAEAFDPPQESAALQEVNSTDSIAEKALADQAESTEAAASEYRTRIDEMATELRDMKEQLEQWRSRCEIAESGREADRKSLAEMVLKIRQHEEERQASEAAAAAAAAAATAAATATAAIAAATATATAEASETSGSDATRKDRGRSKNRRRGESKKPEEQNDTAHTMGATERSTHTNGKPTELESDGASDKPTLSRANTITPQKLPLGGMAQAQDQSAVAASLPYASMLGVVLLGMGLMAYINGWQASPKLDR